MSFGLVLFAVYAIVALVGGVAAIAARGPRLALWGLSVALLAGTCAYVQVMASAVAAVQLVMLAGAGVAALRLAQVDAVTPEDRPGRRWARIAAAGLGLAGLAWVLVGIWARQYVWTGRELPPDTRFGSADALAQAWSEAYAPAMAAALLALLVVAIVGVAEREHRL